MADIRPNHSLIQTHRGHKISPRPEILPGEVPLPGDLDRTLTLDLAHHVRNRILRRNADTHMNVVAHQVTFYYFRFLVPGKLMKYLSKMPLERTKNLFLPPLRDEHDVILTIPPGVGKTLVLFQGEPLSLGRNFRFTMTAVQVKPR